MDFALEVESCKIQGSFYCIWFEGGVFNIEDVEAKKFIPISATQLRWFINSISKLLQGPSDRYFQKKNRDDYGPSSISKFKANAE